MCRPCLPLADLFDLLQYCHLVHQLLVGHLLDEHLRYLRHLPELRRHCKQSDDDVSQLFGPTKGF